MSPVTDAWAKDVDREQNGILDRTNVNGGVLGSDA
jgi:acetyl-CoA acyltransferase